MHSRGGGLAPVHLWRGVGGAWEAATADSVLRVLSRDLVDCFLAGACGIGDMAWQGGVMED